MLETLDRIVNWLLGLALIASALYLWGGNAYLMLRELFWSRRRIQFNREWRVNRLERLLAVVSADKANMGNFVLLSILLAAVVFVVLVAISGSLDLWIVLVTAGVGLVPLLIQWGRLQSMRIRGSYEGMDLVTTLMNSYIVCGGNMTFALDMTVSALKNCPYSKLNIARLAKSVKTFRTEAEMQEAVDVFVYSYRTEWANILGFCIFTGIHEGTDIRAALESLIKQFKRARQVMEKGKRYNRETFVLMKVLIPAAYLGLMYYGSTLFGKSFWEIMARQFTDPMGLKLFIAILIMICGCWVLSSVVSRPKYDL